MHGRRLLLTCLLYGATLIMTIALTVQAVLAGTPHPLLLSLTVVAASAAVAYPLATAEFSSVCRSCGMGSLGLGDFGFCLRCGVPPQERSS